MPAFGNMVQASLPVHDYLVYPVKESDLNSTDNSSLQLDIIFKNLSVLQLSSSSFPKIDFSIIIVSLSVKHLFSIVFPNQNCASFLDSVSQVLSWDN